jgi:2'-5' RNA ligase
MRLFVALDIPEEVRTQLAAFTARLRPACRNARWVRIEGLHVTLKFIGEMSEEKLESIQVALAAVPTRAPIPITYRGLGFFPDDRRPHILWAGIKSGPELAALAAAVDAALGPLGIPGEQREFTPHLTIARLESPRLLESFQNAVREAGRLAFGRATAENFHLYQSVLKPGGSEYTRLATFSFAGSISE